MIDEELREQIVQATAEVLRVSGYSLIGRVDEVVVRQTVDVAYPLIMRHLFNDPSIAKALRYAVARHRYCTQAVNDFGLMQDASNIMESMTQGDIDRLDAALAS